MLKVDPICGASCETMMHSTRHMPSFPLSELEDFIKYLQTVDGGRKSEQTAKLIAKDVSKLLYYGNEEEIDWGCILDRKKLL